MNRRQYQQHIIRPIHEGRGFQSSVYLVECQGEQLAVKDFALSPKWFRRFIAPVLVKREVRALRHLNGTRGIPRFAGRVDRLAFAMQFIEGTPISTFGRGELAPEVFPRIAEVVAGMHARGVAHGDLKRRSNLILSSDGSVWIIDFAASVVARGPISRRLMQAVAEVDDKSLPRLKRFVAPELLTEEDKWKLDNPTKLERWAKKLLGR
jgi:predicted Ser/Thr protein kinase